MSLQSIPLAFLPSAHLPYYYYVRNYVNIVGLLLYVIFSNFGFILKFDFRLMIINKKYGKKTGKVVYCRIGNFRRFAFWLL